MVKSESVPHLSALRYTDGLRKCAAWERTWDFQRQEDANGVFLDVARTAQVQIIGRP